MKERGMTNQGKMNRTVKNCPDGLEGSSEFCTKETWPGTVIHGCHFSVPEGSVQENREVEANLSYEVRPLSQLRKPGAEAFNKRQNACLPNVQGLKERKKLIDKCRYGFYSNEEFQKGFVCLCVCFEVGLLFNLVLNSGFN